MAGKANRTGNKRALVVANGAFRVTASFRRAFAESALTVACDGAAERLVAAGLWPDVVIGDGDSLSSELKVALKGRFRRVREQATNDLAKALRYCARQGVAAVTVLGAAGRREDHLIGNVFRLLDFAAAFAELQLVTPSGRFEAFAGRWSRELPVGTSVSVFAAPGTAVTSEGFEWPLKGVRFSSPAEATLNRTNAPRVTLCAEGPALVYLVASKPRQS